VIPEDNLTKDIPKDVVEEEDGEEKDRGKGTMRHNPLYGIHCSLLMDGT